MRRRLLSAAIFHLDRIACPTGDQTRAEVERIVLTLLAEDDDEAHDIVPWTADDEARRLAAK